MAAHRGKGAIGADHGGKREEAEGSRKLWQRPRATSGEVLVNDAPDSTHGGLGRQAVDALRSGRAGTETLGHCWAKLLRETQAAARRRAGVTCQ